MIRVQTDRACQTCGDLGLPLETPQSANRVFVGFPPTLAQMTSAHLDGSQDAPSHEKSKITGRRRLANYRRAKSLGSLARGDDGTGILPWWAAGRARTRLTADEITWTLLGQMPCGKGGASDLIRLAPIHAGREHLNMIQHDQVLRDPSWAASGLRQRCYASRPNNSGYLAYASVLKLI